MITLESFISIVALTILLSVSIGGYIFINKKNN